MKEEIKSYNHNFHMPYRIYSCVNLKVPKTTIIKKQKTIKKEAIRVNEEKKVKIENYLKKHQFDAWEWNDKEKYLKVYKMNRH